MKRKILAFIFSIIIFVNAISYSTITAYAFPKRLLDGTWVDVPISEVGEEVSHFISYALNQMGVFIRGGDFEQWLKNNDTYKDLYDDNGRLEKNVIVDKETGNITFKKELTLILKNAVDDYAKEHEPYSIYRTIGKYDANLPVGMSKNMWDTMVNLLNESPSGIIAFAVQDSAYQEFAFTDVGQWFNKMSPVRVNDFSVCFYNNETWNEMIMQVHFVKLLPDDEPVKTWEEVKNRSYKNIQYYSWDHPMCRDFKSLSMDYALKYPENVSSYNNITYRFEGTRKIPLISTDGRRIRVYNTYADFQNATLDRRSVYYTKEYYSYVPEDLTTSIDDLQQTVDDLSGVIDKLLGQITGTTDESEIEDLLKQILDELKNNQGSGGGGGGGGDVNVDIDLSATNTLLSKILAKVTQIFDKMDAAVEDAGDAAMAKIQESLDEIIVQLKKIRHWTIADTVIDAADAVADWADLILGVLEDAKEGAGSAVAAIATTVGDSVDMMSQKFPFSVPWDILLFVSLLSAEPQMPYFEIPFNIELSALGIQIDYTMKLDFSQLQWLSDLSRLILSMTYAVGLLKMTAGITSVGKEG